MWSVSLVICFIESFPWDGLLGCGSAPIMHVDPKFSVSSESPPGNWINLQHLCPPWESKPSMLVWAECSLLDLEGKI